MTHAEHEAPEDATAEPDLIPEPEPETPAEYWQRMAEASAAGVNPEAAHSASVACPNPACTRRGQWYQVPAAHTGPLHCGGCFAVLHCPHDETTATSSWGGTVGSPLVAEVVTCNACHHEVSRSQQAVAPADVPLALLQAVHSA